METDDKLRRTMPTSDPTNPAQAIEQLITMMTRTSVTFDQTHPAISDNTDPRIEDYGQASGANLPESNEVSANRW